MIFIGWLIKKPCRITQKTQFYKTVTQITAKELNQQGFRDDIL